MPRDGTATRERLLRAAERIFATRGYQQATSREITEAAGQRNASAVAYHFGSKERLLWEILARHGDPIDAERGALTADGVENMTTRQLVMALLIPYSRPLGTEEGRDYLRIVAQLTGLIPSWRTGPLAPPNLRRILAALEARAGGATARDRQERVVLAASFISVAMAMAPASGSEFGAQRRTEIEEPGPSPKAMAMAPVPSPASGCEPFLANLADMLVAGIEASTMAVTG